MSVSGNLRTMPLPDVLQWVAQSRKTGTLVLEGDPYTKKIYFNEGLVVAVASENPKEFLGYFLVGWGYLGEEELQELLDMQEKYGALLGELLVIVGQMSREELSSILQAKSEECIYEVFLWEEGEFRFIDDVLPSMKFQPLDLPVDMVVMEGVRRQDEWGRIREVITDDRAIPKVVKSTDVERFGRQEMCILGAIDGSNCIEDIGLSCRIPAFHVQHFLFNGLQQGYLEMLPPDGAAKSIPGFTGSSWRMTLKEAEEALEAGDLLEAYRALEFLLTNFGEVREALEFGIAMRKKLEHALQKLGFGDDSILEIALSPAELTGISCSPEEGFLLSRVSGAYTVGEILNMLPGVPLEQRLLIDRLIKQNILRVRSRD